MCKKSILFTVFVAIIASCTSLDKEENSQELIDATAWVQNSGEYKALTIQAFQLAKLRLEEAIDDKNSDKPHAVILDIDETILDNSPFFAHLILNNKALNQDTWAGWKTWTKLAKAQPLPGALDFLKYAEKQDVEIFYISNRDESERAATLVNLENENFPNAKDENLYLKNTSSSSKTDRFEKVEKDYEVLLYIGDNLSDFSDKYYRTEGANAQESVLEDKDLFGSKFIVLPNPMYGDWETFMYEDKPSDKTEKEIKLENLRDYK